MYYIKKIKEFLSIEKKILIKYGFKTFVYDFLKNFIFRRNFGFCGKIGRGIYHKKYEHLKKILYNRYCKEYLEENVLLSNTIKTEPIRKDCPIWVFWWQGIDENTPEVVKRCIYSVTKYKGNHELVIVSQSNIKEYLDLPVFYYEKLSNKEFSLTHFSDIVRMNLLFKYGGIWMDATIIMTDFFNEDIYSKGFYSIKHELYHDWHVCKGKWTGFFLATVPGNPMFKYFVEMFDRYWLDNDFLLCYLLIDCFIAIGYEQCKAFKNEIDAVPINNTKVFFLDEKGNDACETQKIKEILRENYLFKLHYKKKFEMNDSEGKDTFWKYVITNI